MAVTTHCMYWYMVTNYTNSSAIGVIPWSLDAVILLTRHLGQVVLHLQDLDTEWEKPKFMHLVEYPSRCSLRFRITLFEEAASFLWTLDINMATVLFVDFVIAVTLCYYLYKSRSMISHRTNFMLNVLIRYTINTGLATSVIMLVCLVTYATMPNNFVYIGVYFTLSKLYLNSLLVSLNAREKIKMSGLDRQATNSDTETNTTMLFTAFPGMMVTSAQPSTTGEVRIHVDVETSCSK
ncbi:hypothetical protein C8Q80DRAFT_1269810 [Daedaleopsis nitida]|nr:hypothetical protein C8Q80DRAFT_1269810 [Daedaleopsis nitida]